MGLPLVFGPESPSIIIELFFGSPILGWEVIVTSLQDNLETRHILMLYKVYGDDSNKKKKNWIYQRWLRIRGIDKP